MSIKDVLQSQRRVLLDLTYRNRLLNLPRKPSSRSITVHDELSVEILRLLLEKKSLSFTPVERDEDEERLSIDEQVVDAEEPVLHQPDVEDTGAPVTAARHTDSRLQTKLKSEHLQKRLLEIYYEARTMLEEQGVNVLYLALGQLRFRERPDAEEFRQAPLVLVPVMLERKSARERFHLRWTEDDLQENLSLREKLRADFGITLPDFPDTEAFDLPAYFARIREGVSLQAGWEVVDNAILLGFFSFAKLLMFLDLDPANWPEGKEIDGNPLVSGLLGGGFAEEGLAFPGGSCALDQFIPVAEMKHIMDCDSSQALAIETVRRGHNLVIQGPPGTGKSQTIANLIAAAVGDGKKVLFVSEKMAALEVVKRRLENVGLGPLCLELHSNKSNKKAVLEELGRTLHVGRPQESNTRESIARLEELRAKVNAHAQGMHAPVGAARLTPYRIIGELARLQSRVARATYPLPAAVDWTMTEAEARAETLRELCDHLPQVGDPALSPWRGITHPPVLRPQAEEMVAQARMFCARIGELTGKATALAHALGLPLAGTLSDIDRQCAIGEKLAAAPAFDRAAIGSGVWSAGLDALRDAVRSGRTLSDVRARRASTVVESAWDIDWLAQRQTIAAHGRSWLRWLNGAYRQALNQLRSVAKGEVPKDGAQRLALLDDLIAGHKARHQLESVASAAKSAFGAVWRHLDTDWDLADSILAWVEQQASDVDMRKLAAEVENRPALDGLVQAARSASLAYNEAFRAIVESHQLDLAAAFDGVPWGQVKLSDVAERATRWSEGPDGLMRWMAMHEILRRAQAQGLDHAIASFSGSPEQWPSAVDQFWMEFFQSLVKEAAKVYPDLARFDGRRHDSLIQQFREWDRARLTVAQVQAAQSHHAGLPKATIGKVGTLGQLRAEIAKKRGQLALRKLFKLCGSPIQAIKPVFMMSPLSVAQYLEPGAIEFDLLVIDEASQVEPVDALGAIARCRSIVVVGDDRQLPPTSFFSRIVSGEDLDEEEEGAQARDLESVLSLCAAKGLPQRMLQWHYRSRHESLIAVSNKEFYEGNLFIVPSPDRERRQTGLRFHHFPEGRFDRGNSYKNHVEAVAIAQAVVEHARRNPHLTLGVGAMSVRQRQAISDEIELARRRWPELEAFIARHPHEPFFVKNLENIQGDERDVIFISIGYGRSKADDKMYQNFGPLNADGGHRRLNVLITRARERCEVFSSIVADDIRVDGNSKHGVIALKAFLKYAQHGDLGIPAMTGKGADSPFEKAVQAQLVKRGYQVDNQVGVAGFYIDLAVVDPDAPGRYLLGIECDGASYHAAPSARDRDRLRQEVLEAHGWNIHRIWSTDWFQREAIELARLEAALSDAKARRDRGSSRNEPSPVEAQVPAVLRRAPSPSAEAPATGAPPYRQADFRPEHHDLAPHEVPVASMARTVERILEIEGPMHEDELVARVRDLWGLSRAGSRIKSAVKDALRQASFTRKMSSEGDCWQIADAPVPVRDRSEAASRSLKNPDLLPPQELREAILTLVRDAHGIRQGEIAGAVARILGFQATSQQLRDRIDQQVDLLLVHRRLKADSGFVTSAPDS